MTTKEKNIHTASLSAIVGLAMGATIALICEQYMNSLRSLCVTFVITFILINVVTFIRIKLLKKYDNL